MMAHAVEPPSLAYDFSKFRQRIARGIKPEGPPEMFEGKLKDFCVIDPDGNKLDIATRLNS